MEQRAKSLRASIQNFNINQAALADPQKLHHVPFPFPYGTKPEDRFLLDDEGNFEFMGRVVLPQLVTAIETSITKKETLPINVYGTKGYGKSHIIAAVVVLLMKKKDGLPVLFLPQVRDMASLDAFKYLRAAALLTFATNDNVTREIQSCELLENLANVINAQTDRKSVV